MKTFKQFNEGLAKMALKTGAAVLGGVLAKKGIDKLKKFDPVGDARKNIKIKKPQSMKRKVEPLKRMVTLDNYEIYYQSC